MHMSPNSSVTNSTPNSAMALLDGDEKERQPLLTPKGGRMLSQKADGSDIVQWSASIFYVEEQEAEVTLDVMRLGTMKGWCKVRYQSINGTAVAGVRYKEARGSLVFNDGEDMQSIIVPIIPSDNWSTTQEFQVKLSNNDGCSLGNYLHTCRVKVIDSDMFPSSRYREDLNCGADGISRVGGVNLFIEFIKLIVQCSGLGRRTMVLIVFDQLDGLNSYVQLYAILYLVDVVFNKEEEESSEHLLLDTGPNEGRTYTAFVVAAIYLAPMLLLHIWAMVKVRMALALKVHAFLKISLFTKYLNYNEGSRSVVSMIEMQNALTVDSTFLTEGFMSTLKVIQLVGKVIVISCFVYLENPAALPYVFAMPIVVCVFACCRAVHVMSTMGRFDIKVLELLKMVNSACIGIRLIEDYQQRPRLTDLFTTVNEEVEEAEVELDSVRANNRCFARWLGPVFICIYVVNIADSVIEGSTPLGSFVAMIRVFQELSTEFSEAFHELILFCAALEPLKKLTKLFNMQTILLAAKSVAVERARLTKIERAKIFSEVDVTTLGTTGFRTDLLPLKFFGTSFSFGSKAVFKDIHISQYQGGIVAVVGGHGSGKATVMKLVGGSLFPGEGVVFIPSHLRTLYVSQEVVLLDLSAWANLTFGCPMAHPKRVRNILRELQMFKTIELITGELADMGRLHELEGPDGGSYENISHSIDSGLGAAPRVRWQDTLAYGERACVHLARALIMNPEVIALQRPCCHHDDAQREKVMRVLAMHVDNRGFMLSKQGCSRRRPRSMFYSPLTAAELKHADFVWEVGGGNVRKMSVDTLRPSDLQSWGLQVSYP